MVGAGKGEGSMDAGNMLKPAFYPKDKPARNVEAFDKNGNRVWTIESLGGNPRTDCYTSIKSVNGLIHAFNFQCYDCVINEKDGSIVSSSFTK